jgi:hypothetical protein
MFGLQQQHALFALSLARFVFLIHQHRLLGRTTLGGQLQHGNAVFQLVDAQQQFIPSRTMREAFTRSPFTSTRPSSSASCASWRVL